MSVLAVSSEMMVQMVLITSSFNRTHVDPTSKYILNTQFSHPPTKNKENNERMKENACLIWITESGHPPLLGNWLPSALE